MHPCALNESSLSMEYSYSTTGKFSAVPHALLEVRKVDISQGEPSFTQAAAAA